MKKLLIGSLLLWGWTMQAQQLTDGSVSFGYGTSLSQANTFSDRLFPYTVEYEEGGGATVTVFDENLKENRSFSIGQVVEHVSGEPEYMDNSYRTLIRWGVNNTTEYGSGNTLIPTILFNSDTNIEYGIATWKKRMPNDGYEKRFDIEKIEVFSENGQLIGTLPQDLTESIGSNSNFPETVSIGICQFGSLLYIQASNYELNTSTYWKINRESNGTVGFVKAASFKGYPNPVDSGETFTVEISEDRLGTNNRVEVRDSAGRLVAVRPVKDGKAQLPTCGLKGMCVYTVTADGQTVDSGKIIVR